MLHDLLADHETIIRYIRSFLMIPPECDLDIGTIDLLTDAIQDHEKMAWVTRAALSAHNSTTTTSGTRFSMSEEYLRLCRKKTNSLPVLRCFPLHQ